MGWPLQRCDVCNVVNTVPVPYTAQHDEKVTHAVVMLTTHSWFWMSIYKHCILTGLQKIIPCTYGLCIHVHVTRVIILYILLSFLLWLLPPVIIISQTIVRIKPGEAGISIFTNHEGWVKTFASLKAQSECFLKLHSILLIGKTSKKLFLVGAHGINCGC